MERKFALKIYQDWATSSDGNGDLVNFSNFYAHDYCLGVWCFFYM